MKSKLNQKDLGGMAQVTESWPNKCKILSFKPSTTKTKTQQNNLIFKIYADQ
jgi:hypothetical protein